MHPFGSSTASLADMPKSQVTGVVWSCFHMCKKPLNSPHHHGYETGWLSVLVELVMHVSIVPWDAYVTDIEFSNG